MKHTFRFSLLVWGIFLTIFLSGSIFDDEPVNNPPETYTKVNIKISSDTDLEKLHQNDITIEHYHGNFSTGIELVLNSVELSALQKTGLSYEMVIPDMSEFYKNRPQPSQHDMFNSEVIMQNDDIDGFYLGTMGGFCTYAEVVRQLDSMRLLYPNLITSKIDIGTTHEARKIWAVKISDNPDVNESGTEAGVYYDALHHAREPISMQAMLYYMYWLLENYGTDPEATYLVNNREIFFVPIVNPDGYEYNRSTDPNGGGNWRKNRRNNGGSFGVDLNRNYSYGWGLNSGSSNNPASDTYRGPSAFSEPETQAVRDFVLSVSPEIGFSIHSVAGRYLNPYGYTDTSIAYNIYQDFSSEFAPVNNYLYGTVAEMLNYYSSGTTRDYLHATGTYCWTPELGGSDFWPVSNEIVPLCSENLYSFKYLAWVSGAYSRMQSYKILDGGYVNRSDTLKLEVNIRNKGITKPSNNVSVTLSTAYPNINSVVTNVNYGVINPGAQKTNTSTPFKFFVLPNATVGDEIKFLCTVSQEGVVSSVDTVSVIVGKSNVLFFDDAENGITNWSRSGSGSLADTSFTSFWAGSHSFADSRYGNSLDNTTSYFTMNSQINLAGTVNPRLEFNAKWATEDGFDYTRIQISTNNGSSWTTLAGKYTSVVSGQQSYDAIKYWVQERINLNSYIGQNVKFRFYFDTDGGVPGDGFYFDNFRIVNYTDTLTSIISNNNDIPDKFDLYQNYPNPFNPATSIKFDIPRQSSVKLRVFDALGREVGLIANGDFSPGRYSFEFNAAELSSGIYFYKLEAGDFTSIKKMILIK